MQFTYEPSEGPLPLRFGMTRDTVGRLFASFEVPSAFRHHDVSPQNAIGAYPEYDDHGTLWCVEFSPRCSLLYKKQEVFDDESENLIAHLSSLFGKGEPVDNGWLFSGINTFAVMSRLRVESLLVFADSYRRERFGV